MTVRNGTAAPASSYWTGDEWRWRPEYHRWGYHRTISVIEPAAAPEEKPGARRVPFGFARVLMEEPEPLLWEGDNA